MVLSHPRDWLVPRLLYRDGMILIIDKPQGLAVHSGPGGGETLDNYLEALRFGLPGNPQLGHRLDRDTSGCLVLGRHRKALRRLGQMFQAEVVTKTYVAAVQGELPAQTGIINAPLEKRSTAKRGWWMQVSDGGKDAETGFRVLASGEGISLVELSPRTGRTHQLRVHLAHLGCPILGDPVYGDGLGPLMLHAFSLKLPIYRDKPAVSASAALPSRLLKVAEEKGLAWPEHLSKQPIVQDQASA